MLQLQCVNCAVLFCRSYAHFCNCGKQLDSRLEALGGLRIADRIDVHREDLPAIDKWLAGMTSTLKDVQLKTIAETGGQRPYMWCCALTLCIGPLWLLSITHLGQELHTTSVQISIASCNAVAPRSLA